MTAGREPLVHYIRRLATQPASREEPDAALLGRFVSEGDEAAFAALVERHGPLVLTVCRRVLGDGPDAEDAFQAAFLVLARKAAAIYPREALAAWLHGVARRVALKAYSARARQGRQVRPLPPAPADPRPDPLAELTARELLSLVDEEIRQLPEVYRLPVILCCLEGRTLEEAARLLGWTSGSVKGRLERGRARLHQRLVRRGLTLSAALTAAGLSRSAGLAAVVERLVAPTVRAALGFAAGHGTAGAASAQAAARAAEVVKAMALARLRVPVALLLLAGLLAAGFAAHRAVPLPPETPPARPPAASADLARDEAAAPEDDSHPIKVSGRVLDPAGRPLAGARLYVGYTPRRSEPDSIAHRPAYPLRTTSGADGRFRFTFTRSSLDERYLDASRPVVVAVADGFGLDWAELAGRAENAALTLRLVEDFPVRGRILGPDRVPVAGARVVVRQLSSQRGAGPARSQQAGQRRSPSPLPLSPAAGERGRGEGGLSRSCWGPLPGLRPVTTDAGGRFRLSGVGRGRSVSFVLEGANIPHAGFVAEAGPAASATASGEFERVIAPLRPVRGVVRDKATGQPVAGVRMSLHTNGPTTLAYSQGTLTDGQGRYELRGHLGPRGAVLVAQPQSGQPYFAASMPLRIKPGQDPSRADFELVSGIPLRGRVTNSATGKPPKRAVVEYYPLFPNPHSAALTNCTKMMPASSAPLGADGSYSLMVLPGPGVVLVAASPRDSYAVAFLDDRELAGVFKDGLNHGGESWVRIDVGGHPSSRCVDRYNALALIKPDARTLSLALDFTVQPARRLRGTVVGPDGQPLSGVTVVGLTSMPDAETLSGPSFTVEGLNPRRTRALYFHHGEKRLGKVLTLRGETQPLTVRLEPFGEVVGRTVDRQGKPVAGVKVNFFAGPVPGINRRAVTDQAGLFRVALVAGQKYALMVRGERTLLGGDSPVEVEPGRSKDLGDLPLTDPRPWPRRKRRAPAGR